jgi:hypothetical protein
VLIAHVGAQALEQARHQQTRMSRQRHTRRARARQVWDPGGSEQPGTSSSARVEQLHSVQGDDVQEGRARCDIGVVMITFLLSL